MGYDFMVQNNIVFDVANDRLILNKQNVEIDLNSEHSIEDQSCENNSEHSVGNQPIANNIHHVNSVNYIKKSKCKNKFKSNENDMQHFENNTCEENIQKLFARNAEKHKISPNSSKIIELTLNNFIQPGTEILIQPRKKYSNNLDMGVAVISNNNCVYIPFQNNSQEELNLNKDAIIADIEENLTIQTNRNENSVIINNINNLATTQVRNLRKKEFNLEDFNLKHLDTHSKNVAENILRDNFDVFSKSYHSLGVTDAVQPRINLRHSFPIQTKAYKLPYLYRKPANEEIQQLLSAGIIEESNSSYSFPVIFVKKKQSTDTEIKLRMAIDYRILNSIMEGYNYNIGHIQDILQNVAGKQIYCVLDLKAAFFQIKLHQDDRKKLAFICEQGIFQPLRLPFGLCLSTSYFSKLMDKVLGDLKHLHIHFFLDDIIIAADNFEDATNKLLLVFKRLRNFNLTLDPQKVQLFQKEIEYLGFKINSDGYSPSDKNIQKIAKFPQPKTAKHVKSFLGVCNYFRTLIENYATLTQPLIELTKKEVKFNWSTTCQQAFENLQNKILGKPVIKSANFDRPFYLITDASKVAVSAILLQQENGNQHVVQYYSRVLKDAETRYPSVKLELLAIFEAVRHFKDYLIGTEFEILSDAKALSYHLRLEKQPDIVARWILYLQNFKFKVRHIDGESNPADWFSRQLFQDINPTAIVNNLFQTNSKFNLENILKEQQLDQDIVKIRHNIENNSKIRVNGYLINSTDNLIYFKYKPRAKKVIVLPSKLHKEAIIEAHSPHFGIKKTLDFIRRNFFWKGMLSDVKNFCQNCTQCILFKSKKIPKFPIQYQQKSFLPGEHIAIDLVGKLTRSSKNCQYILTIIDHWSRYLETVPLKNIKSSHIIKALKEYFARFGIPKVLLSDNGPQFISSEFNDFLKAAGIQHNLTSIYRPQANGVVERSHKILKESISCLTNQTFSWEDKLLKFKNAYNSSQHSVTGYSPAMLFFGRELRIPADMHNDAQTTNLTAQQYVQQNLNNIQQTRKAAISNQKKYNEDLVKKSKIITARKFKVGQTIYLKAFTPHQSLQERFVGPFKLMQLLRNQNILLKRMDEQDGRTIKAHIDHCIIIPELKRKFREQQSDEIPAQNEPSSSENLA